MFTIHLADLSGSPVLNLLSWHAYGFSDAAELFVFLAGLVYGMVFSPSRAREGVGQAWRQGLRRAGQLYLANLVTFLLLWALLPLAAKLLGWTNPWANWWQEPWARLGNLLLLIKTPAFFDILFLFAQLMLFMPLLRALYVRRAALAWSISLALYATAPLLPQQALRDWGGFSGGLSLFFNPLAWQFLFFLGMAVGLRRHRGYTALPRWPWGLPVAIAVLVIALGLKLQAHAAGHLASGPLAGQPWLDSLAALMDKQPLGPLRLLHFLALVWVAKACLPYLDHPCWHGLISRALRAMGHHSLVVFCVHVVVCYGLTMALANLPKAPQWPLLLNFVGWGLLFATGAWLARRHHRHRLGSYLATGPAAHPEPPRAATPAPPED